MAKRYVPDNVVLIGPGGIGWEIAKELVANGISKLLIFSRSEHDFNMILNLAERNGVICKIIFGIDLEEESTIARAREEADVFFSGEKIDCLIIASGIKGEIGHPLEESRESILHTMSINFLGPQMFLKNFIDTLQKGASVITLVSSAIFFPPAWGLGYAASKASLDIMMRQLSQIYPQIRFLNLYTGYIKTPMVDDSCGILPDTLLKKILLYLNCFRFYEPKECAALIIKMLRKKKYGYLPYFSKILYLPCYWSSRFFIGFMRRTGLSTSNNHLLKIPKS